MTLTAIQLAEWRRFYVAMYAPVIGTRRALREFYSAVCDYCDPRPQEPGYWRDYYLPHVKL